MTHLRLIAATLALMLAATPSLAGPPDAATIEQVAYSANHGPQPQAHHSFQSTDADAATHTLVENHADNGPVITVLGPGVEIRHPLRLSSPTAADLDRPEPAWASVVSQLGDDNILSHISQGDYNNAVMSQQGDANRMSLTQQGRYNHALLAQFGSDNAMTATQLDNYNEITWTQVGDALPDLDITQTGGMVIEINQSPMTPEP